MAGSGKELATAYVTLIPSLKGAERSIEADLARVDVTGAGRKMGTKLGESIGDKAGKDASDGIERGVERTDAKSSGRKIGHELGNALSDAVGDKAPKDIERDLSKVDGREPGRKVGDDFADAVSGALDGGVDITSITDAFSDALSGGFDASAATDAIGGLIGKVGGASDSLGLLGTAGSTALGAIATAAPIAAAAVAAIGGVAIDAAADFDTAEARITAAVGGAGEAAETLKDAGRDLYEDGWGESMTQLSDSLITAREILGDISEEDMTYAIEGALALEEVYGSDLSETLRGVRVLMQDFGLSAEEAMDLVVSGTQRGLDYTDELGDNLSEYAGRWADAGVEASEYFSLLEAGVDGGAYSLDKAGDFLNEFLTSLSDGRMEEAIGSFSQGTQDTFEAFKTGGADAQDVLNAVVGELAGMPDEYQKAQIASELWSSLGEDNAMSMIESFADVEDTFSDVAGASQDMTDQVSDDLGSRWDTALRKWQSILEPVGQVAIDIFGGIADGIIWAGDALSGFMDQQDNFGQLTTYFGELDTTLTSAMESMGYNVDYLKLKLSEAGVGMEELDAIGSGHIRSLASTFNGDVESMVWAITNYNDVPIIDKDGAVDINDAELIDAQGNVWTWNGSELVDQNGNVAVADQQLIDAQGRIYTWNGSSLTWKSTGVSVDSSAMDSARSKWQTMDFAWKRTGVTVGVYTNNVPAVSATGGVMPSASTAGFIATGPTLINGGQRLVGEAGAEAVFGYQGSNYIVPLTNRKYSAPFADVVAQQVVGYLGGGGSQADALLAQVVSVLTAIYDVIPRGTDRETWARDVRKAVGYAL